MNDSFVGIVLKQTEYRENDILLHVFFKEVGKLTLVVKGGLKENSKNKALCTPFTCSKFDFDYSPLKTMFVLKTGVLQASNHKITANLEAISSANLMSEILMNFIVSDEPNSALYELFSFCLNQLHNGNNIFLVTAFFISQVCKEVGIEPEVDECVNCGSLKVNTISLLEGGFVCEHCAKNTTNIKCDIEMLKAFRYINKAEINNFIKLSQSINVRNKDVKMFADFLMIHTGIKLNNWRLFEQWTS